MSIDSWCEEFMPISALSCPTDDHSMISHALLKWSGALPENLKKHGVYYKNHAVSDGINSIKFNALTCALCYGYPSGTSSNYNHKIYWCHNAQKQCPFFEVNQQACPYAESRDNPKIMVDALTDLVKWYP